MPGIDRSAAANAIDAFLRAIGRDPATEPELAGTGARVADAYADELCAGYAVDTRALVRDGIVAEEAGGLVIVRDVPVSTTCPHHLLPASGVATVALMAVDEVVGLGTVTALVQAHARRLTLQETIGERVVADLDEVLGPSWVACKLVLEHACMIVRGDRAAGAKVETLAVRGISAGDAYAIIGGGT